MANRRHRRAVQAARVTDDAAVFVQLNETFERQRRRHNRLGRLLRRREDEAEDLRISSRGRISVDVARERVGYHVLWSRWSESYDDVATTAALLLRTKPRSLADLGMMFSALEWMLLSDGAVVDRGAERKVRRFSRALRRLAAG